MHYTIAFPRKCLLSEMSLQRYVRPLWSHRSNHSRQPRVGASLPAGALLLILCCSALLCACASRTAPSLPVAGPNRGAHPIRYLLTFDDGPSASAYLNPTVSILEDLAHNPVQDGIKAIFFVQTRAGGATALGRSILQREYSEGHLLGFHTATAGHFNHRRLNPVELAQSLGDGITDLTGIAGGAPKLVRPPFWNYDQRTFEAYQAHGLRVMLTDLSANDGQIWFINFSLRKRSNLRKQLAQVRAQMDAGAMPVVDGEIPVIVTFHDVNSYTARHMQEYLEILMDVARELGMPTAARPFYDDRAELERAALARTIDNASQVAQLPGLWNWWWN